MATPFIKIEGLSYRYDEEQGKARVSPVLNDLSMKIEDGSFVAVLGHNGSGKSTLAKLLNMILTPTEGKITLGYNIKIGYCLGYIAQDIDRLFLSELHIVEYRQGFVGVALKQRV